MPWPDEGFPVRRASINSFGYGGSNAHAVIERPSAQDCGFYVSSYKPDDAEDMFDDEELSTRPYTLVLSANDAHSLKNSIQALSNHLANPRVKVNLEDLAYTLSERRTRHWHRAFLTTRTTEINEGDFTVGKNNGQVPKIALVFTGQGAQWPQMGKDLLEFFPWTRAILEELDAVLQAQADPPQWSLLTELTEPRTPEHMRQPEFSQPLVTALQLCILAVLESWGVKASSVVGHSSGEIAAAYAAGLLDRAGAIKAAFYRGRAAVNRKHEAESNVGMLAVGLGPDAVEPFMKTYQGSVWIACFNSPSSLTISGKIPALEAMGEEIKAAGHFARLLQVDLAYHSALMGVIGEEYETLLNFDKEFTARNGDASDITMFSSVTGSKKETAADALYWKTNMVSPVRFAEAFKELITQDAPNFIIEVGPSGALAGPVSQVLKSLTSGGDIPYCASWARGAKAGTTLFDTAGRLFMTGSDIDMSRVNEYNINTARTIVDLPNYCWNHTIKYWHENAASKDWRNKKFITHDLLGSKIPGTSWQAPTWRKHLKLADVPWLRDHKMGPDVLVPGAGLATLALEAMYQKFCALNPDLAVASPNELAYRFRNVKFDRAVVVEETKPTTIMLTLSTVPSSKHWHEFRIRTTADDVVYEHCSGLIRVQDPIGDDEALKGDDLAPLRHPQSSKLWYKAQAEVGMGFGPTFQKIKSIESVSGSRTCRTIVSMEPPPSKWDPQSYYPVHPAVLDGCLQTATPANAAGERSLIKDTMIPALVDDMVINKMPKHVAEGLSVAESVYTGRGRKDVAKSWTANVAIHDPETGALLMRVRGLNYIRLDVDEKPDPHVFHAVTWKPDISFLSAEQITSLQPATEGSARIDTVIDLVAQKTPALKILEINLDDSDVSALWFEGGDDSAREAYAAYHFATRDAQALVSVQTKIESKRDTSFHLAAIGNGSLGLPVTGGTYDLAIVKAPVSAGNLVKEVVDALKPLLNTGAFTLVLGTEDVLSKKLVSSQDGTATPEFTGTPSEGTSGSGSRTPSSNIDTPVTIFTPAVTDSKEANPLFWADGELQRLAQSDGLFGSMIEIADAYARNPGYLGHDSAVNKSQQDLQLTVPLFRKEVDPALEAVRKTLALSGWNISFHPIEDLASNLDSTSVILVLDELVSPLLSDITEDQWDALKRLISTGKPLLWVTYGGQTSEVTDPNNAMVHGLFRVIRREDPQANLTTLDVQSPTSPSTVSAIEKVIGKLGAGVGAETEYAERNGIIYMQRILPDKGINDFKTAESGKGLEPVVTSLHANKAQIRIQAEKIGTLQSLTWCETAVDEVPMEPGMVEIEVMAVGVNFKVSPRNHPSPPATGGAVIAGLI
jgi:acyl transferase domain-containing protein